jgi:hypothetical protein
MALPTLDPAWEPPEHVSSIASDITDMLRKLKWLEAADAVSLVLGFMHTAIENDEEVAMRMSLIANKAMAITEKFRRAAELADDEKPTKPPRFNQ